MTELDRRLTLLLAVIALAPALALLSTLQAATWLFYSGAEVPWTGLLRARLVDAYCYAVFLPLLFAIADRFPFAARVWPRALAVHLAASLVFAVAKETLFTLIGNWFRPGRFDLIDILAEDYSTEVFTFWALIAAAYVVRARFAAAEATPQPEGGANDRFVVRDRSGSRFIPVGEVAWIDAQGNYARLNTADGRFLVRETMASLEQRLAGVFVRVHRRALVNVARVAGLERKPRGGLGLRLDGGETVAVGRAHSAEIRRRFG